MGWRSEIEVTTTIDLCDYDDEIMEYMEPDNINDAMDMMQRWGYSDGDIIEYMLDDVGSFLEKVSNALTVETALALVKDVYEYGEDIRKRNLAAKDNRITELSGRIDELLQLNHQLIAESNDESSTTNQADGVE
jgi:hypothetical protein